MARRRAQRRQGAQPAPRPKMQTLPPSLKTTVLFALVALYLGGTMFKLVVQEITLFKQSQILQAEKAAVVAQHEALAQEIALSKTNAGIERLAREQLGLVMPAEIPVKTAAAPPVETPVAGEPAAKPEKPGVGMPPAMAALAKFFTQ